MYVMPSEATNLQFRPIDRNYCAVLYNGSHVGSVLKDDEEYVVHVGPAGIRFRETCKAHVKRTFILFLGECGYISVE